MTRSFPRRGYRLAPYDPETRTFWETIDLETTQVVPSVAVFQLTNEISPVGYTESGEPIYQLGDRYYVLAPVRASELVALAERYAQADEVPSPIVRLMWCISDPVELETLAPPELEAVQKLAERCGAHLLAVRCALLILEAERSAQLSEDDEN